jgi:hypothetical protein
MQTSKVKLGELYAYKRGNDYVRFRVTATHTSRTQSRTSTEIEGHILEDAKDGQAGRTVKLDPAHLEGPYDQVAALVERKRLEDEARAQKTKTDEAEIARQRCVLYRFVGVDAPKNAKDYHQLFRDAYGNNVDISKEGVKALVAKIESIK